MSRERENFRTAPPTVEAAACSPASLKPALQLTSVLKLPTADPLVLSRASTAVENECPSSELLAGARILDDRLLAADPFDDPDDEKTTQFDRYASAPHVSASAPGTPSVAWLHASSASRAALNEGPAPSRANGPNRFSVSGERVRVPGSEVGPADRGRSGGPVGAGIRAYRHPPSNGVWFALGICAGVVLASVVFVLRGQSGRVAMFIAGEGNAALDHFSVEVDGQQRCDTRPCVLDLDSGTHVLRAQASGYLPHEVEIAIEPGSSLAFNVTLRRGTMTRPGG